MAVWEVAQATVAEGREDEFESVIRSFLPALREADGLLDVRLLRAIDREGVFLSFILWESVEKHTEVFLKSETFAKLSAAMAPLLTAPPVVFHAITAIDGS